MKTLWAKLVRWLARKEIEQMAGEIRRLREQAAARANDPDNYFEKYLRKGRELLIEKARSAQLRGQLLKAQREQRTEVESP